MEGLFNFVSIIIILFGILQIVLFFKLWSMTDDIRAIKNKYLNPPKNQDSNNVNPVLGSKGFQIGALVENVKTEKTDNKRDKRWKIQML